MNVKNDESLFRQQVIDEFNSKLNGEVILSSSFTKYFIVLMVAWVVFGAIVHSLIKIEISQNISGSLVEDKNKNLVANFSISPDVAQDFYVGKIITVNLQNVSSHSPALIPIEIVAINSKLKTDKAKNALIEVRAVIQDTTVFIGNKEYTLGEGIVFSFNIYNQKASLIEWIKMRYFSGEQNGY